MKNSQTKDLHLTLSSKLAVMSIALTRDDKRKLAKDLGMTERTIYDYCNGIVRNMDTGNRIFFAIVKLRKSQAQQLRRLRLRYNEEMPDK